MNRLDPAKLTSVNEHGDRVTIIPASVRGYFRKHRDWSQLVLLAIFLLLPWTTINGHQTILLDIPQREFALFGMLFKAHDIPLLFFILGPLALGLALVTSIWGRVWCGWACPQTVFIDGVFRRIETWVEGSYIEQRRRRDAPMSFDKFSKYFLKWVLFVLVSSLIAHSFMAYFIGAKSLLQMMQNSPGENFVYFFLVLSVTALVLFDFAWFREQFCVIMCPYGRLQSVLLDQKSLAVVYDVERGEPRKGSSTEKSGDCVSCNRCVQVCPTGIDIRNGLQMECIACTACIDACDEIMEKVKKPKGLIRYDTLDGSRISLWRFRSVSYMLGIALMLGGLAYALSTRTPAHWSILRGAGLPYSFVKGEMQQDLLLNQFRLHIQNQGAESAQYEMTPILPEGLEGIQFTVAENPISLKSGEFREWYFFVRFPPELTADTGQKKIQLRIKDRQSSYQEQRELILLGPKQR